MRKEARSNGDEGRRSGWASRGEREESGRLVSGRLSTEASRRRLGSSLRTVVGILRLGDWLLGSRSIPSRSASVPRRSSSAVVVCGSKRPSRSDVGATVVVGSWSGGSDRIGSLLAVILSRRRRSRSDGLSSVTVAVGGRRRKRSWGLGDSGRRLGTAEVGLHGSSGVLSLVASLWQGSLGRRAPSVSRLRTRRRWYGGVLSCITGLWLRSDWERCWRLRDNSGGTGLLPGGLLAVTGVRNWWWGCSWVLCLVAALGLRSGR